MSTFEADGITVSLDNVIWTPARQRADPQHIESACYDEALFVQESDGGPLAEGCLVVQWRFHVADDFVTDQNSQEGGLSADALITPEGQQIDSVFAEYAYPGTVDNGLVVAFAGGVPGSTLKFETGSNAVGWTTHTYEVPPLDAFMALPWIDEA